MDPRYAIRTTDVCRRFDKAADSFDDADFVHGAVRDGLFARLEPLVIDAKTVVDLGCATGAATKPLSKRFRGAHIIAVDLSSRMLQRCASKQGWLSKTTVLQADARDLPFDDHSVDVVFSNLMLPWVDDPAPVAAEVSRVLRKEGLFLFSTLGPDSLLDLRRAWLAVDDDPHVNSFLDMHDVGDALVRSGLRDPVLDVDRLTVTYESAEALFRDLTAAGARSALRHRRPGLTGRGRFDAMRNALQDAATGGRLQLDLELVFGHCWGSGLQQTGGDVRIDPLSIPVRGRN